LFNSNKYAQLVKVPPLVVKVLVLKSLKQQLLVNRDLRSRDSAKSSAKTSNSSGKAANPSAQAAETSASSELSTSKAAAA